MKERENILLENINRNALLLEPPADECSAS
jgi:hypothetical protein